MHTHTHTGINKAALTFLSGYMRSSEYVNNLSFQQSLLHKQHTFTEPEHISRQILCISLLYAHGLAVCVLITSQYTGLLPAMGKLNHAVWCRRLAPDRPSIVSQTMNPRPTEL